MYRVLLPEGELTLSSRIEFLKETVHESGGASINRLKSDNEFAEVNCIFIHLKAPYTTSDGVLIGNLSGLDIVDIKSSLLKDNCYDFTRFTYSHDAVNMGDTKEDEKYYANFSESDFLELVGAI